MTPLSDDAPHQPSPGEPPAAAAGLVLGRASSEEWLQVEEWAAEEEWNPGFGDTACFHPTDPAGFFLGRLEGKPVTAVSVVNYSDDFSFLGYYLVDPAHRGKGLGMATWNEAVPHAGGRTIGLDAVPAQEETYRRSGFVPAYRTGRYSGRPTTTGPPSPDVTAVTEAHIDAVAEYDRRTAEALFDALTAHTGQDEEVHVDVPETHEAAVALAVSRGLQPGSHTVRMYAGPPPPVDAERVFGVTSLELG